MLKTCLHLRTMSSWPSTPHSHAPQGEAVRQLTGETPRRPTAVAVRMQNLHERLEEHRNNLR
jgi:hypothetical protein